jgi:two-component sensor histidine kinase
VQRYEVSPGAPAIVITLIDLTYERKREDTLKALLRELSHRTKNLLAIVQSIATQTALSSDDLESFVSSFRGRVAALSSAQDLVIDSNWRGAMFKDLAIRQLSRYVENEDPRIEISGPDVLLLPNGATHVGLALHELIANAIGYGALSNGAGHIKLASRETNDGMFEIVWDEDPGKKTTAAPETIEPEGRRHFGSTVLQRVVPMALEGEADYSVAPGHVHYRLRFVP